MTGGEWLSIKAATFAPALAGGFVYAIRIGDQSFLGRFTGGVAGVLSAMFVGPGVVDCLRICLEMKISENLAAGLIFLVGVTAAVLLKPVWGFAADPAGTIAKIRNRGKK